VRLVKICIQSWNLLQHHKHSYLSCSPICHICTKLVANFMQLKKRFVRNHLRWSNSVAKWNQQQPLIGVLVPLPVSSRLLSWLRVQVAIILGKVWIQWQQRKNRSKASKTQRLRNKTFLPWTISNFQPRIEWETETWTNRILPQTRRLCSRMLAPLMTQTNNFEQLWSLSTVKQPQLRI